MGVGALELARTGAGSAYTESRKAEAEKTAASEESDTLIVYSSEGLVLQSRMLRPRERKMTSSESCVMPR
jgi:hypothetical protein